MLESVWSTLSYGRRGLDRGTRLVNRYRSPGTQIVFDVDSANELIGRELLGPNPVFVGRVGATEQAVLRRWWWLRSGSVETRPSWLDRIGYGPVLRYDIKSLSGVFPTSGADLYRFGKTYVAALKDLDVLGVWGNRGEQRVISTANDLNALVPLTSLAPLERDDSWTRVLEGRHVLVVHPFTDSISRQLSRLDDVWPDRRVPLADYELLQAPQTLGGTGRWPSWSAALNECSKKVTESGADIALIGAGAYGLPLAHAAYKSGKKTVLVGGALQLFFGIRGTRWDSIPAIQMLSNDTWVRPAETERPPGASKLERGAYW